MSRRESLARVRAVWIGSAAIAVALGVVLFATGVSPWVAPLAVLFTLTLAIGQRTSWPFALAAAVIAELALVALVLRFTPAVGLSLVGGAAIMFGLLGAIGIAVLVRLRAHRFITRRELRVVLPLIAVPALAIAVVAAHGVLAGILEWAMRGDAVWNLVTARMLIADGGLDAVAHPNASPLTPGLLAITAAVGRDVVPAAELLRHDVGRFATFWLAATAASALLAALIGARSVHGASRTARVAAAAVSGLLPFTWFMFGFATQFGFYNASLTILLLLASWLAWLETRVAPVAGAAGLSLAAVALLATWAPVAIIPFALAVFALLSRLGSLRGGGLARRRLWLLALAAAPVPLYAVVVTLPDLRREGAALAVDGGIFPLQPVHVAIVVIVALVVSTVAALHLHQRHALRGLVIVLVAAAAAGAYLLWQRAGEPTLWGYYPVKFAWLVCALLLVVLTAAVLAELAGLRGRRWTAAGVLGLAAALPLTLMAQVPPTTDRAVSVLTPIAIATQRGVAAGEPAATRLFALSEPGRRTLALSYLGETGDRFLNSWLLQLESTDASDPIRVYAYLLDPADEAQACDAVRTWGGPVRVVTSDPTLPERFADGCAGADAVVEVRAP